MDDFLSIFFADPKDLKGFQAFLFPNRSLSCDQWDKSLPPILCRLTSVLSPVRMTVCCFSAWVWRHGGMGSSHEEEGEGQELTR
jgi:hypothetical protein